MGYHMVGDIAILQFASDHFPHFFIPYYCLLLIVVFIPLKFMKQRNTIIVFLILCSFCISAQSPVSYIWLKTKGSKLSNGNCMSWGIDVDTSGNVYWPVSFDTISGMGYDIATYKLKNSDGSYLWASPSFFGGINDQQSFVTNAQDTFLYVGGRQCSGGLTCDKLLNKIDKTTGQLKWSRTYNSGGNPASYDEMDGLEIRPDGIYTGGWSQNPSGTNYDTDLGLWKLDFSGNTLMVNQWGTVGKADHQDGHFVVDNNAIYTAGLVKGTSFFNLYGRNMLGQFSKTTGAMIDTMTFGNPAYGSAIENALGMTSDGTYLYVTGFDTHASNGMDIFIAKYDKTFSQKWIRYFGGTSSETARAIAVSHGYIFVGGASNSPVYSSGGGYDAILLTLDTANTNLTWSSWGHNIDEEIRDLAVYGNSVYVAGSQGLNMFQPGGHNDSAFVMRVTNTPLATPEINQTHFSMLIYPNPSSEETTINFTLSKQSLVKINIFDIVGRKVKALTDQRFYPGPQYVKLYTSELPEGTYLCVLEINGAKEMRKVFITK
jgi:hypothetical protein